VLNKNSQGSNQSTLPYHKDTLAASAMWSEAKHLAGKWVE